LIQNYLNNFTGNVPGGAASLNEHASFPSGLPDEHLPSRGPPEVRPRGVGGVLPQLHPRRQGGGGVCQEDPRLQRPDPARPGQPAEGGHL